MDQNLIAILAAASLMGFVYGRMAPGGTCASHLVAILGGATALTLGAINGLQSFGLVVLTIAVLAISVRIGQHRRQQMLVPAFVRARARSPVIGG